MSDLDRLSLFSEDYQGVAETALRKIGVKISESKKIADAILRLSNYYISYPQAATPWKETWAQVAYICYFHPLNKARCHLVINRGQEVGFFKGIDRIVDYGAGLGSATECLTEFTDVAESTLVEASAVAQKLLDNSWKWFDRFEVQQLPKPESTLAVFSYSLTELEELPKWALQAEALMILEPATHQDGRKLLALREQLIEQGFFAWAPCLHQQPCPLLHKSKTDWCHDRVHLESPAWFHDIEKHLPFRNETLTTSYLLLRKKQPVTYQNKLRTVGDHLKEKGKSRQMVCRGPEREFISWLHREFEPPVWPRGAIVDVPEHKMVSSELRVTKN